jgi:hypothetical protein
MKRFVLYIIICFCPLLVLAQPNNSERKGVFEKKLQTIQAIKETYFNKELNLTDSEKESFWPVYNKYFTELKLARIENRNDILVFEEKVVGIRKNYMQEFKKVLGTDERARKVFLLDRNFSAFIKKELFERQRKREDNLQKKAPTIEN